MLLDIATGILGAYIVAESINEMRLMDGGDHTCRVFKYVITSSTGLAYIWYAATQEVDTLHFASALAICSFMWPHFYERLYVILHGENRKQYENRIRGRI